MPPTDIRTALAEQRRARSRASWLKILKQTASEWIDDNATTWAAAVACYTLLALAPLLVIAIRVVTIFQGGKAAQKTISGQAVSWMGPQTAEAIKEIIDRTAQQAQHGGGWIATIVSLVIVVLSAGGVFAAFQQAMNRIWKVKPKPGRALLGFLRARLLSVVVVAIAVVLLLGSVVVATELEHITKSIGLGWKYFAWGIDVLMSLGVLTLLFALLYRTVPDARIAWRSTWVGAFCSAVLFQLGKYGLALYFKYATPSSAFGAVGSLAAILIWIYYSAQILFFGAELTQAYAKLRGHGVRASKHAQPLSQCDETETATPSSEPPHGKPLRPQPSHGVPVSRYGAVLAPHARGAHAPGSRTGLQEAQHRMRLRTYLAAGAGMAVGMLIGGYGALQARGTRAKPGGKEAAAARLSDRIKRVEQKLGRVSRIRRYLEQENLNQRIDTLRAEIRDAGRKARQAARRNRNWTALLGKRLAGMFTS